MAVRRWAVGVDFGGTVIKLGAVNAAGRIALTRRLPTAGISRPGPFLDAVAAEIRRLAQRAGVRPAQLAGVGIGAPGLVDAARGIVRTLVNVPGWRDVALARHLQRRLGCLCRVDNDANLFTLGEWRFGAGRGARRLVGVTLGTGIGGGLVCDGTLYRGASGAAGELGHLVVDPRGPRCGCGARGCLEAVIGTAGILRLAAASMRRARPPGGRFTPAMVSQAARAGDRAAGMVWRRVGHTLGLGLSSVINLLNPDRIVIGGGVANAWPFFAPALRAAVRAQAMRPSRQAVSIARARLGDRAGVVGAAVLIWRTE